MDKTLTIVVPTYNMEKYLEKCLSSLIINDKELLKCLEVLVVIDGATDGSCEIAHSFEKECPETFRVIEKENGNYGSCVNRGLKEASGKYIKILDADDWFNTEAFEKYLRRLQNIDVDLVLNDFCRINANGEVISRMRYADFTEYKVFGIKEVPSRIYMWMHGVAWKTSLLHRIHYKQTEGISYTDQEWIFLPMTSVDKIFYMPLYIYQYFVEREGQTCDADTIQKNINQEMKGLKVMLNEYEGVKNLNPAIPYLEGRLLSRIIFIYSSYLTWRTCMRIDELINFDYFLKENYPQIYSLSEDSIVYKEFGRQYFFIKLWRETGRFVFETKEYRFLKLKNTCLLFIRRFIKKPIRKLIKCNRPVSFGTTSHESEGYVNCCTHLYQTHYAKNLA